jgi:hypothetical protein
MSNLNGVLVSDKEKIRLWSLLEAQRINLHAQEPASS